MTIRTDLFGWLTLSAAPCAAAARCFCGAYPDVGSGLRRGAGESRRYAFQLVTGLPRSLRLSPDHKTIYVSTNDHNGIEVIDVATRKVTNHFVLNTPPTAIRMNSGAPDPAGKLLYASTTEITKEADHFDDRQAQVHHHRSGAAEDRQDGGRAPNAPAGAAGAAGGGGFEVSPDGKYLYQFGQQVTVLNAADFSVVEKIDLELPGGLPMENIGLGGMQRSAERTRPARLASSISPIPSCTIASLGWRASI